MYRRQEGKLVEYVLIKTYCEDVFINGMGFWVSVLYTHSVVSGVVNCINGIYGDGTQSARRYRRNCEVIIMFEYIYTVRSGDQFFYPSSRNL